MIKITSEDIIQKCGFKVITHNIISKYILYSSNDYDIYYYYLLSHPNQDFNIKVINITKPNIFYIHSKLEFNNFFNKVLRKNKLLKII